MFNRVWHNYGGKTLTAKPFRNPQKEMVSCTFKLTPAMYKRLQDIKIERGISLQGLLEEAVDLWLAAKGEAGFKRKGEG